MTTTPETVSGTKSPTNAEQLVCATVAWHEKASVYVLGAGKTNLPGTQWRVYAINGTQRTLLGQGVSQDAANQPIVIGVGGSLGVDGQGDTIALYVIQPAQTAAVGVVKAYLTGWDPSASITPNEASDVEHHALTLAEQDFCALTGGYVSVSASFNANGDPLAVGAIVRVYALCGTDRFLVQKFTVQANPDGTAPSGAQSILSNYPAGADSFVMTVQGRRGNSAVQVYGVLEGNSPQPGSGGGPPVGSYWPTTTAIPATVASPELAQAAASSDVATQAITMRAQDAFAGATGANEVGGDIVIQTGVGMGIPEIAGDLHVRVGDSTDVLTIDGSTGIVFANEALATPELVLTTSSASIVAGNAIPGAASAIGSLYLFASNPGWNPLYVWNGTEFVPVAVQDLDGVITFDPANTAPGMQQAMSTVGGGNPLRVRSQEAKTGSTTFGGHMSFILGADDPPEIYGAFPRIFYFGVETGLGGIEPTGPDYVNSFMLKWLPGGVANFLLGGGTNATGGGVAGNEISAFASISIATENQVPIDIVIAGVGPTSARTWIPDHDTTDEAAWSLAYFANHPTSGDVAGVQIIYTETAIGTGVPRWVDMQKAGVRELDLRPWLTSSGLTGGRVVANGYLGLESGVIIGSGTIFQWLNSGVFGLQWNASAAQLVQNTGLANSSHQFQVAGVNAIELTGTQLKTQQGLVRNQVTVVADYTILVTDELVTVDVGSPGFQTTQLPLTPVDGQTHAVFNANTGGVTLDGNGINILQSTSATTKAVAAGTGLRATYNAAKNLWLAAAAY